MLTPPNKYQTWPEDATEEEIRSAILRQHGDVHYELRAALWAAQAENRGLRIENASLKQRNPLAGSGGSGPRQRTEPAQTPFAGIPLNSEGQSDDPERN